MLTGNGKPMKVFTPYHRAWLAEVKSDPILLDTVPAPSKNSADATKTLRSLFDSKPPTPPEEKQFADESERKRIRSLWPAGHDAAVQRLNHFLTDKISDYAATRSNPAKDSTSRLSAYFAAGVLSVRETLSAVRKANKGSADFSQSGSSYGIASWVREIVFRELYRQTTLTTPHTAMNLPQNLKFDFVHWEDDQEGYDRWEQGTLGVPFVDAGMRQIKHEAYMHNRLRMNVSSYLYCNLLIDYRRGERYFAETLIDWDLNNNTQGWEPSYTVFNPVSQAEKNDPEGEYIRKWVPELKNIKGKAVFDPYHRLPKDEFEKLGYPAPYVDWKETKQRAIERFKSDMKDADP
jgi:deoxyribodipyrimidine photo-lyase